MDNIDLKLNENWKIYQQNDYIIKSKKELDNYEKLFELVLNNEENYELLFNKYDTDKNGNLNISNNNTWFPLVRSTIENLYNKYELKEGNIIKLGNIYLKLKRLKLRYNKDEKNQYINLNFQQSYNGNETTNNKLANFKTNLKLKFTALEQNFLTNKKERIELNLTKNPKYMTISQTKKDETCRICYLGDSDEDNPLIHPCSCLGSMKYIHFKCLKLWLEKNSYILEKKTPFSLTYKYKEPICELCKSKYHEIIYYKGKEYSFLDTNGEFDDYVIFEILFHEKNQYKILFVLSLDKKNQIIKIGRALDNHIVLSDNSISRNHCGLVVVNNKLFIEDMTSKFGTLILIQTPKIQLTENLNLYLQIGNNFIKCKLYFPALNSLFSCCSVDNKDNESFDYYYKQNIIKSEDNNNNNLPLQNIYSDNENDEENQKENDKDNKLKIKEINYDKKTINERFKKSKTNNIDTKSNLSFPINEIRIIPKIQSEN